MNTNQENQDYTSELLKQNARQKSSLHGHITTFMCCTTLLVSMHLLTKEVLSFFKETTVVKYETQVKMASLTKPFSQDRTQPAMFEQYTPTPIQGHTPQKKQNQQQVQYDATGQELEPLPTW